MTLPFEPEPEAVRPAVNIYSEQALWLCENRKTKFKTRIHGALAQILKKYPADYRLKLLSVKGDGNEHATSAHQ